MKASDSVLLQFIEFYHFIYLQIKHEAAAELVRRKSEPEHARTLKSLAAQEETAASSQGVESKRLVWCRNGSLLWWFHDVSHEYIWECNVPTIRLAPQREAGLVWRLWRERERESLAIHRHQSSPKHVARCCKPLTLPQWSQWSQWLGIQQSIAPIAASPSQLCRLARFAFLPELSLSQDGWLMAWEGGDTAGYCLICLWFWFSPLWKCLSPLGPPSCGKQKSSSFIWFDFSDDRLSRIERNLSDLCSQRQGRVCVLMYISDWPRNAKRRFGTWTSKGVTDVAVQSFGIKRVILRHALSMFVFPLCVVLPQHVMQHVFFWWIMILYLIQHRGPIGVSIHGQDAEQHPTMR